MANQLVQTIYWDDISSGTNYLYGSKIYFFNRTVRFENVNFASGKPIKRWRSRTNYQGNRVVPDLPLLIPGRDYRLIVDLVSRPHNRTYLQLDFYNSRGERVGYTIIKKEQGEFTYPEESFTYTITLYGAGCKCLIFKKISIFEIGELTSPSLSLPSRPARSLESLPDELELVSPLFQEKTDFLQE